MSDIRRLHRRTRFATLRQRESLVLDNAQGTLIAVDRGCLWVTLEHDPRDIVLVKGTRFEIDRPGRTIVAAESHSSLRLLVPVRRRDRLAASLQRAVAALRNGWSGSLSGRALPYF